MLFDVRIRARDIRLRLIIIEVADEVFDCVTREELFELGIKLRGQSFVVRDNQSGSIQLLDNIGNCEGLARACHAEQCLMAISCLDRFQEFCDSLPLIATWFEVRLKMKRHSTNFSTTLTSAVWVALNFLCI